MKYKIIHCMCKLVLFISCFISGLSFAGVPGRYYEGPSSGGPFIFTSFIISILIGFIVFFWSKNQEKYGIPIESTIAKLFHYGVYLSGFSIVIGFFDMPPGYFFYYLRIVLCGTAVLGIVYLLLERKTHGLIWWVLIGFAILFNPVFPKILGSGNDDIWKALDLFYLGFLIYSFKSIEGSYYKKQKIAQKEQKELYIDNLNDEIVYKTEKFNTLKKEYSGKRWGISKKPITIENPDK